MKKPKPANKRAQKARELGKCGEEQALDFLRKLHFRILCTNFTQKSGELDIVAEQENCLCIIEVKTRKSDYDPIEAVTSKKQKRIIQATKIFQIQHQLTHLPVRFDILAIRSTPLGLDFQLLPDAFSEYSSF
jgi:putative endonuclease